MHASRARSLKRDGQDHSPVDDAAGCRAEYVDLGADYVKVVEDRPIQSVTEM